MKVINFRLPSQWTSARRPQGAGHQLPVPPWLRPMTEEEARRFAEIARDYMLRALTEKT